MSVTFVRTAAPTLRPLSLTDLKDHARVETNDHDTLLSGYITAATEMFEEQTGRCLITQDWQMTMDAFPSDTNHGWWDGVREGSINEATVKRRSIRIPRLPVQSVLSVNTYAADNTATEFASSNYYLVNGELCLSQNSIWPVVGRDKHGIEINLRMGYGDAANTVPTSYVHALKMLCTHWYENPELYSAGINYVETPASFRDIVENARLRRL